MFRIYTDRERRGMWRHSLDNLATLATPAALAMFASLLGIERGRKIDWTSAAVKTHANRIKWAPNDPEISWALQPFFSASNGATGGGCR